LRYNTLDREVVLKNSQGEVVAQQATTFALGNTAAETTGLNSVSADFTLGQMLTIGVRLKSVFSPSFSRR
jgi:hypothetical protein